MFFTNRIVFHNFRCLRHLLWAVSSDTSLHKPPLRKSSGSLMCGVVAPAALKVCPPGGPAARGFWKIRGRSEVNSMQ